MTQWRPFLSILLAEFRGGGLLQAPEDLEQAESVG